MNPAHETQLFKDRRAVLVAYLIDKAEQGDWHAVSDAANDLRVLEAAYEASMKALK